jgi:hypothetical protein
LTPGFRSNRGYGWRASDALDHLPALGLRLRRAFLDADGIADLEFVVLVVRAVLLGLPDRLLENRVLEAALDRDGDGLRVRVEVTVPCRIRLGI